MKLLNVPFVIITLSAMLGILLGYHLTVDPKNFIISFFVSICILGITWQRSKKIFRKTYSFTLLMIVVFVIFGAAIVNIHNPKNHANHYTNQVSPKNLEKHKTGIKFQIKKRLKPSAFYTKYIVSINFIKNKAAQGDILLQIPKDSSNLVLDIGRTFTVFTRLKTIHKPLNPKQFDYAQYLGNLYIWHQITVSSNQLTPNQSLKWSLFRLADQIRKSINLKLANYSFNTKQLAIINALLLGQRQDIDQDTFNTYRDAGAIHILAVSGLHVGILLLILNWVLKPLDHNKRIGKNTKLTLTIILLWCFAIIAGLSPSVLRAVTMFSFLAIGMQIRSKTSVYNSLFISMFVLLCFDPLLLFSIGFQLSYLAVFAIVWIQPIIAKRYTPKFYILKKLWETFTVTIAAQLGLLPLTLFYFHQFPGLFFVSNVLIIPFLGGIIGLGILVILLAFLDILPQCIATFYGLCINTMNTIIGWVAQQEPFLITNISFSCRMLATLFFLITMLVMLFQKYEKRKVFYLGTSIILVFFVLIYEQHKASNFQELVIFHHQRNTTIGVLENQRFQVYGTHTISKKNKHFIFGNYLIQNKVYQDTYIPLKNAYRYKEHTILIIDSTGIYSTYKSKPDILLLSGSPKIHLERVIDSLKPKQIIADGSNYKSYIDQWEKSCKKREIPFYRTDKKGAYILR